MSRRKKAGQDDRQQVAVVDLHANPEFSERFTQLLARLHGEIRERVDRAQACLISQAEAYVSGAGSLRGFLDDTAAIEVRLAEDEATLANLDAIRLDPDELWNGFESKTTNLLRRLVTLMADPPPDDDQGEAESNPESDQIE